jgi:hypothetical protein
MKCGFFFVEAPIKYSLHTKTGNLWKDTVAYVVTYSRKEDYSVDFICLQLLLIPYTVREKVRKFILHLC